MIWIQIVAGVFSVLAFGGLVTFYRTRHVGVLLNSIVWLICCVFAVVLGSWWPFLIMLAIGWILRWLGLEPR